MLDLIFFGSSVVIAKLVSPSENSGQLMISSSPSTPPSSPSRTNPICSPGPDQVHSSRAERNIIKIDPESRQIHRAAQFVFQAIFLLSLWLFSLSILEASPTSWLIIIDQPHIFILLYRLVIGTLIILLMLITPSLLGVILALTVLPARSTQDVHISLGEDKTLRTPLTSATPSKHKAINETKSKEKGKHPFRIILRIITISFRFLLVASWFLLRKLLRIIIPTTLYASFSNSGGRDTLSAGMDSRRRNCCVKIFGMIGSLAKQSRMRYCSFPMILAVLSALSLSFMLMGMVMAMVIRSNNQGPVDGFAATERSATTILAQEHQTKLLHPQLLKYMLSMVCSFGLIIASILNGFGCVSLPHSNLVGLYLKPTCPIILKKIEEDYGYTLQSLQEKKLLLVDMTSGSFRLQSESRMRGAISAFQDCCLQSDNNYRHGLQSQSNGTITEKHKIQELREEINFLENLVGDMYDDIEEMKHAQQLATSARTTFGRIRGLLGVVFSVVLVIRVALAAYSFAFIFKSASHGPGTESLMSASIHTTSQQSNSTQDPLTTIVLWLIGHDVFSQEKYDLVLQGTSLLLAGILSISQIRNFLRVASAIGRKLSRLFGISLMTDPFTSESSKVYTAPLLLAAFTMGSYFCACVVMMKMILPIEYRSSFSSAVGQLDLEFNTVLLNIVFTTSACTSAVILGLLFGIQRNNTERYQLESQLSSFGAASPRALTA